MDNFIAHILVVDDDDGIRSLVKKYLNENNFLISTAENAEDEKKKIELIRFDLTLLDEKVALRAILVATCQNGL